MVEQSVRASVTWLHDEVGLTWKQLGLVFGTSRNMVWCWSTGTPVNESQEAGVNKFKTTRVYSWARENETSAP